MTDLAFLLVLLTWSAGVGLWVLRRFGPPPDDLFDALALAVPLGLGALALAVLGLGDAGALDQDGIRTVLITGSVLCVWGGGTFLFRARGPGGWGGVLDAPVREAEVPGRRGLRPSHPADHGSLPDRLLAAAVAAALVGTLLTALAPVTDGDALCYHLQVPKRFLERGSAFFDPDLHETVYPLLTEMLYAVALAVRGPVACRLVQWGLGLTFVFNVTALARPVLGRRAWWAGAVALLVPAVSNGMTAPLNDVALAAFGTAALHSWTRFRDRPSLRAALLTGVLTGLAMGVKYPALVLAGLIGLSVGPDLLARPFLRGAGVPWIGRRKARAALDRLVSAWAGPGDDPMSRPRRRLVHSLAFALAAWAVGGCWYARAFWFTGNPVHPFFRQAFAGAGLDEVLGPEKRPLAVTPWNLLTALGPLTLAPDTFDSFSHQFGPIFLLFLPALALERPPRRVLGLAAIGYTFLAICLTQRQSMRFVLPALGPLAVAVAWLANSWSVRRTVPGRVLVATFLVVLGLESGLSLARTRHGLGVVLGFESASDYLARREPTYRVGRWVSDHLPATARIVGQDHRGFYIPRPYTMELAHRRRTGLGRHGESPTEVVQRLREAGFTHLMLCPPEPETAVEFDPTLSRLLEPWLSRRTPVYREDLADADGVVRRYAIFELGDEPGVRFAERDRPR
jgi:hypothetical protein